MNLIGRSLTPSDPMHSSVIRRREAAGDHSSESAESMNRRRADSKDQRGSIVKSLYPTPISI